MRVMDILKSPMGIYVYYYLSIQKLIFLLIPNRYRSNDDDIKYNDKHNKSLEKCFNTKPISFTVLYKKLLQYYATLACQIFGFWMLYG